MPDLVATTAKFTIATTPGNPLAIDGSNLITIWVKSIQINPQNFSSSHTDPSETFLTIILPGATGPQSTIFPFRGKASQPLVAVDPKYLNKILYLGEKSQASGIRVSLIESNANTRDDLSNAEKFFFHCRSPDSCRTANTGGTDPHFNKQYSGSNS